MRGGSDEKLSASPPPGDKTRLWNEFSHPASPSGDSDSEAWVVAERENREARYDGAVLSPIGRKRAKEMSRKKFAEVHTEVGVDAERARGDAGVLAANVAQERQQRLERLGL